MYIKHFLNPFISKSWENWPKCNWNDENMWVGFDDHPDPKSHGSREKLGRFATGPTSSFPNSWKTSEAARNSFCLCVPQTVFCWGSQCCLKCVRLGWGAVSASLGLSPNLSPNFFTCGFVFHLGWGAVSASLGLSPNLSPSVLSPFVSHLALSFTLAGVLRPPRWACLRSCLPICLPPGFVFYVGWDAVSASLGLSPVLSSNLSRTWRLGFSMLS